jgi:LysM repeat protein
MDGGEATEAFTKKIGPLPGYVWVIGVAGIAWLIYLRKGKASATAAAAPAGADAVFPSAYGNAPGTNDSTGLVQAGAMGTSTPTDTSWAKMVTDSLITAGGDPTSVSNAITTWLSGGVLDSSQQAIVNTVQRQYGTPPEGVVPVNTQQASSYTGHSVQVQAGDTLNGILNKYYKNENPTQASLAAARISAANNLQWNAATDSYDLKPGQTLKLYSDAGAGGGSTFTWP